MKTFINTTDIGMMLDWTEDQSDELWERVKEQLENAKGADVVDFYSDQDGHYVTWTEGADDDALIDTAIAIVKEDYGI